MSFSIRTATIAAATTLLFSGALQAQNLDGIQIDKNVLDLYVESRTQQPAINATTEQIDALRDQLMDIYLLADQSRADELRQDPRLKAQLELQTRVTLAQAVAQDFLTNNPATDEELKALYDEQMEAAPPLEYKARHILVETQGEAQDLISQLDNGANFEDLAKEKSTGPSGPSGGDLGWFPPERMVPEFSRAVVELENSAYTKSAVQTQFGWHVILREDSRETTPPPFESMRDVLKRSVESSKLENYLDSLRN